jgi:hypothetical protein
MATPFGPNFDPLAQQRRIMRQLVPKDPLAGYHGAMKQSMVVGPLASQRQVMEAIAAPDRMAELGRLLQPVPIDPLVEQRRLAAQLAQNPIDDYIRAIGKLTAPTDYFAAQRRLIEGVLPKEDPLADYKQIVKSFTAITGGAIPTMPVPAFEADDGSETRTDAHLPLPSRTMVLHLLAIASVCVWLIVDGVDAERIVEVMIAALTLADHLYKSE